MNVTGTIPDQSYFVRVGTLQLINTGNDFRKGLWNRNH